jgi:hypothetical protein
MDESSLLALESEDSIHVYRFLLLRTFDRPVCIVIQIKPDGSGELRLKVTDGAGGYDPGKVVVFESKRLVSTETEAWLASLDKAHFWEMSSLSHEGGFDGSQWILEGVKRGRYHVVDFWSPDSGAFRDAALLLIGLSGLDVDPLY